VPEQKLSHAEDQYAATLFRCSRTADIEIRFDLIKSIGSSHSPAGPSLTAAQQLFQALKIALIYGLYRIKSIHCGGPPPPARTNIPVRGIF